MGSEEVIISDLPFESYFKEWIMETIAGGNAVVGYK